MIPVLAVSLLAVSSARQVVPAPPPQPPAIRWEKAFEVAQKKARRLGKPILVDFWADWCDYCTRLDQKTYLDPFVVEKAQDFVSVKVNTEGSSKERDLAIRYDVVSLPTILFLSPEGRPLLRVNGFQGPYQFPRTMQNALETAHQVLGYEAALARDPDDAEALAGLGNHLYDFGMRLSDPVCLEEARELMEKAVTRDAGESPEDRRRTRMLLAILYNVDHNFTEAERLVKNALTLGPKSEDEPKLLFVLGRTYLSAGRETESVETFQIIIQQYPQSSVAQKARETLVNLQRR